MNKRRILIEGEFYHVVMHGHNKLPIFDSHQDKKKFLKVMATVQKKYPFTLLAYCIMPNHYHLLIRSDSVSLSAIMASINLSYSLYYKKRYGHVGTIYSRKFFSKHVPTSLGIVRVSAYIHRNPINCKFPLSQTSEDYLYSSYRYYFNDFLRAPIFLDRSLLYTYLPSKYSKNQDGYAQFFSAPIRYTTLQTHRFIIKK